MGRHGSGFWAEKRVAGSRTGVPDDFGHKKGGPEAASLFDLAEREGFEPSVRLYTPHSLSRRFIGFWPISKDHVR